MANQKMTKREMFDLIANELADNAEVVAFCEHEKELLAKKASGSKKESKTQVENRAIKGIVLEVLADYGSAMRINEMLEDSHLADYRLADGEKISNQKLTQLVRQLVKDGKVVREEEKGKAYFSLAE